MIRHRPFGLGNPYRIEPDQRVPAVPVAGEPLELRATSSAGVDTVKVELLLNGRGAFLEARRADENPHSATGSGGHLSAAASGSTRGMSWVAQTEPLSAGDRLRYRFIASTSKRLQRSRWFSVQPAEWRDVGGRLSVEGASEVADRMIDGSIRWLMADLGPIRVRFALRLEAMEHVVGFGERFDSLDQRGRTLDVVVYEQYRGQGARTYMPMPFAIVVGGDGWAFHVATSRRSWFDVGQREPGAIWVEAGLDPADPHLSLHLLAGDPGQVLGQFLQRTGLPKVPPEWVFRPWMSGNEWNTQDRVMREVERGAKEQIPSGVLVIEAWSDESTFVAFRDASYNVHRDGAPHRLADFRFASDGAWPDPKGLVENLHARGIKVLLWQIPLLKARAAPESQARYDQEVMVRSGYAVREADGRPYRNRGWWFPRALLPDFTSAEARDWWLAKRRYLVEEVGIDGFKTDGGEHAWGDDLRYADGSRGDAGNNRYPVAYAAAYHELLESAGRYGITFSRAGFTGSPAYPCHWAGDEASTWEAFRASITAGLTAGASGIFFWGWDLAGFSGEIPDAELYLRAAGAACFCPIMQYHSEYNFHRRPSRDRTPWNVAERTGDGRVIPIYRRFANLRMSLVPYLVEQSKRCIETSRPLMRALFFDEQDEEEIWNWPYQFFLGDSLLVAPVMAQGVESWPVYLPAGEWVDAWSGERHRGPLRLERNTPLEDVPVYVRAGHAESMLRNFE